MFLIHSWYVTRWNQNRSLYRFVLPTRVIKFLFCLNIYCASSVTSALGTEDCAAGFFSESNAQWKAIWTGDCAAGLTHFPTCHTQTTQSTWFSLLPERPDLNVIKIFLRGAVSLWQFKARRHGGCFNSAPHVPFCSSLTHQVRIEPPSPLFFFFFFHQPGHAFCFIYPCRCCFSFKTELCLHWQPSRQHLASGVSVLPALRLVSARTKAAAAAQVTTAAGPKPAAHLEIFPTLRHSFLSDSPQWCGFNNLPYIFFSPLFLRHWHPPKNLPSWCLLLVCGSALLWVAALWCSV